MPDNSSATCTTNEDCASDGIARDCYIDVPWGEDFVEKGQDSFCDCSKRFGFVGEKCDIPTSTTYYLQGVNIILLLGTTCFMAWLMKLSFRYIWWTKPSLKQILTLKLETTAFIL